MFRFTTLLAAVALILGCAAEEVSEVRRNYQAELVSIVVPRTPEPPPAEELEPAVEGETETAELTPDPDPAAGIEETDLLADTEPVPVEQKVRLDIMLRHGGGSKLPGVTLDITQADAAGSEKGSWRVYVPTADMAVEKRVSHTLEDVDYEEGDGFHVEVRHTVPEAERSEYEEFASGAAT